MEDFLQLPFGWEESYADDVGSLWCRPPSSQQHQRVVIDVLESPPTSLVFLRDYVSPSRPCIIKNAILDPNNPGRQPFLLTLDSILSRHIKDPNSTFLTVDVTPDGRGDCLRKIQTTNNNSGNTTTTAEKDDEDAVLLDRGSTSNNNHDSTNSSNQPHVQSSDQLVFVLPKQITMSLTTFRERLRQQEGRYKQAILAGAPTTTTTTPTLLPGIDSSSSGGCFDDNGLPSLPLFVDEGEAESQRDLLPIVDDDDVTNNGIVYYSRQNDCLRVPEEGGTTIATPLSNHDDEDAGKSDEKRNVSCHPNNDEYNITHLATLFPDTFDWAEEAFGTPLEAVNLWMGNQCSVSSMHKDFYENLFYVASGTKVFCLCPPGDVAFLDPYHTEYPIGQLEYRATRNIHNNNDDDATISASGWGVVLQSATNADDEAQPTPLTNDDDNTTPTSSNPMHPTTQWIYPDVSQFLPKDANKCDDDHDDSSMVESSQTEKLLTKFPHLRHIHPIEIKVHEGELLYLPALWFHRVTQTKETIGVNYWYDMRFDHPLWCYFNFMQQMKSSSS